MDCDVEENDTGNIHDLNVNKGRQGKRNKALWKHFQVLNANQAKCSHCQKTYSTPTGM